MADQQDTPLSEQEEEAKFLTRNHIRMGQMSLGSKPITPSLSSIRAMPVTTARTRLLSFQQPNDGYTALRMSHPHIIAELEQYTLSWTLAGKYILINKAVLADYISNTKELLMFDIIKQAPIYLPSTMTLTDYIQHMRRFLQFLEANVMPLVPDVALPDQVQVPQSVEEQPLPNVTVSAEDMNDLLPVIDPGE